MKGRKGRRLRRRANQIRNKENRARNKINFGSLNENVLLLCANFRSLFRQFCATNFAFFFFALCSIRVFGIFKNKILFLYFCVFCHHFAIFLGYFCFGVTTRVCAFFALCSSSAERRSLALRKGNKAAHNKQTEEERESMKGRGPRCLPHKSPP